MRVGLLADTHDRLPAIAEFARRFADAGVGFVVHAGDGETFVVSDESHDLAWRAIASLIDDEEADPSLRRMAAKWLTRNSQVVIPAVRE